MGACGSRQPSTRPPASTTPRDDDGVQLVQQGGKGSALGIAGTADAGTALVVSPLTSMIYFDLIFFANYGLGWLLSAIFQWDFLGDNNVARIYGVLNICVGVDSFPARPVASIIFVIAMTFMGHGLYIGSLRAQFADERAPRKLSRWVMNVGYVGCCSFMLTYAVPPDNLELVKIHVVGFLLGLLGYALIKASGAIEWRGLHPTQSLKLSAATAYFWSRVASSAFLVLAFVILLASTIQALSDPAVEDNVATIDSSRIPALVVGPPIRTTPTFDYEGTLLVLFALVDPFIALTLGNKPQADPELSDVLVSVSSGARIVV